MIAIPFLSYDGPAETDGKEKLSIYVYRLNSIELVDPIGDPLGISTRTQQFTVSKNLLSSGADALERIISSYKEVSEFPDQSKMNVVLFSLMKRSRNYQDIRIECTQCFMYLMIVHMNIINERQ